MNIFIYWEGKIPFYIQKCINRMKDIFKENLILLDNNSIKKYVPKFPKYFDKIKHIALKVDYLRIALLYHNPGIYLDADCIVFPGFLEFLKFQSEKEFIGLGKENIIDNNSFLISTKKESEVLKNILEEQEKIIIKKKGKLEWTNIGGNLIKQISKKYPEKCLTLDKSPLAFFGWKNSEIFISLDENIIKKYLEKCKKYNGVMLYNKVMKKHFMKSIPENCLLWFIFEKN